MIELPEAVAIAAQLDQTIKGKRVVEGDTGNSIHKWVFYKPPPKKLEKLLPKKKIGKIKGFSLQFLPYSEIRDLDSTLRIKKILNIKISTNQTIDKFYRLFLTLSAQYLDDRYIIIIFICFVIISLIPYQISAERIEKVYNLKRIINSSLAIFIGIILKMM